MEFYDGYYDPDELYHWGIKGMKWGVRRFQNKDGSLTDAGGKRYNGSDYQPKKSLGQKISDYKKASAKKKQLKKARDARAAKKEAEEKAKVAAEQRKKDIASGKIKAKDMTDEELKAHTERLRAEKAYKQLQQETDTTSKAASIGKEFAKKMWDQAIVPAATEAGKQILKDKLIDVAKKNTKVEEFDLDKFWKNRNKMTTQQIMDVNKRLNAEDSIKKKIDDRRAEVNAKNDQDKRDQDMKDYEAFQEKERVSREEQRSNVGEESKTGPDIPYRTTYTSSDSTNPARASNVQYYPTVTSTVNSLSKVNVNSSEYANKVYKGEKVASEILDADGNVIVKLNKNGKRRLW